MVPLRRVSQDPCPASDNLPPPCFACGLQDPRRPSLNVYLKQPQVLARASVDTGDLPNPFRALNTSQDVDVVLCGECRHTIYGWHVICNPRKYGKFRANTAKDHWVSRRRGMAMKQSKRKCHVCAALAAASGSSSQQQHDSDRNPHRDWSLYALLSSEDFRVKNAFMAEFCRLSGCSMDKVTGLLQNPSEIYFCYVHFNHSRYARRAALRLVEKEEGDSSHRCVFENLGCSSSKAITTGRLWRIPQIEVNSSSTLEEYSQMEETVSSHSQGAFHAGDVMGRFCCRGCLYIVMEGKNCSRPPSSIQGIQSAVDRFMVRCVLYALEKPSAARNCPLFNLESAHEVSSLGNVLRDRAILSKGETEDSVRMIPFPEVSACRKRVCELSGAKGVIEGNIHDKTLQKRLECALAGKGVILKKLSHKFRCYVCTEQVDQMLQDFAASNASTLGNKPRPTVTAMREYLDTVSSRFSERKELYWSGEWSLTKEISLIPNELWVDVVMMMASKRRVLAWNAAAKGLHKRLEHSFPVSNSVDCLPQPSIEEELHCGTSYSRSDLLLCVKALKVIEQIVLSRTNGVPGPLTVSVSVSGICEVTPSFVSVLNAMGLFVSYSVTERYRQGLIAERERKGPWDFKLMNELTVPVLQFDNWDITPLHSVKVDGKPLPKVNGSLLQGQLRGKRVMTAETNSPSRKRARLGFWKDASLLGSRANFAESFTDTAHTAIINHFNNVVFGLVALFRGQLVGGNEAAESEYNTKTRDEFAYGLKDNPLNFRTLMLSAFMPHGGVPPTDESPYDSHVVYVEISRDSAADILTVRRFLMMIQEQIKPGQRGRPRYIVLGGDQPSFKMLAELWLESWRSWKMNPSGSTDANTETSRGLPLHEWLVPFPGFFHAEKQAMYSLCKEMLDGIGLEELASCAGLSKSIVSKILKHSHARNNRAVLFNLACAMIIHLIDMALMDSASLSMDVLKLQRKRGEKVVSPDDSNRHGGQATQNQPSLRRNALPPGKVYAAASEIVTEDVISVGERLCNYIRSRFSIGPNGAHFVETVLFSCLIPTIGFHVLSRTAHTDLTEAFWFKHNAILHSSSHLKYQELSLYFAFFRGILPTFVIDELFTTTPGRMVMKLPSFTGAGKHGVDRRGFVYTHSDEALEMLIVRHLKGLSLNFLGHLENSASWLMQVSMFRSLVRYMTGASRSYGRKRQENDGGEQRGPLAHYDRNACQWRTVARMLHIMRGAGFLDVTHRGSEWLMNVFSSPPKRLNIKKDQESILDISNKGKLTSELHASVLFPDVFGGLTDDDREKHFEGRKFKKWTLSRAVVRPSQSLSKMGGTVLCVEDDNPSPAPFVQEKGKAPKRPRDKDAFTKVLQERRRKVTKLKDIFQAEQRRAILAKDEVYLQQVMGRWDTLHQHRHLISGFADCYVDLSGALNRSAKSRFLKYTRRGNRDTHYPLTELQEKRVNAITSTNRGQAVSRSLFRTGPQPYRTIQVDVMNALHYRGNTGQRGTSLKDVVTGKMLSVLRPWITGPRAQLLAEIHLHIDDPTIVISQKSAEQRRRDETRQKSSADVGHDECGSIDKGLKFSDELNVPWSSLLKDRGYKDELASLHLFCGAVAALELVRETGRQCAVFLHGGHFALPESFSTCKISDLIPRRVTHLTKDNSLHSRVVLQLPHADETDLAQYFPVPRSRCIVFQTDGHNYIGSVDIAHGEAETRFIAVLRAYICAERGEEELQSEHNVSRVGGSEEQSFRTHGICQALIVSDDTDVFMILLSNPIVQGKGVVLIINDTVHDVDTALATLGAIGTCGLSLATLYCIAGCDFSPAVYGMSHELYWPAFELFLKHGGSLNPSVAATDNMVELLLCFVYLVKHGKMEVMNERDTKKAIVEGLRDVSFDASNLVGFRKTIFVSENCVGSQEWRVDVRNYIADNANTANELIPHVLHVSRHSARAIFIALKYWGKSSEYNLSAKVVGGCNAEDGYNSDGTAMIDCVEDVKAIIRTIKEVITSCKCKGDCSTRRCSCFRRAEGCIGCGCSEDLCKNRPNGARNDTNEGVHVQQLTESAQVLPVVNTDVVRTDRVTNAQTKKIIRMQEEAVPQRVKRKDRLGLGSAKKMQMLRCE